MLLGIEDFSILLNLFYSTERFTSWAADATKRSFGQQTKGYASHYVRYAQQAAET